MTKYVSFSCQKVSGSWLKSVTPLRLKKWHVASCRKLCLCWTREDKITIILVKVVCCMIYIALNMKSKWSLFTFFKQVPFLIMEDALVHVITKKKKKTVFSTVIIDMQNCFGLFYLSYFGMYCPLLVFQCFPFPKQFPSSFFSLSLNNPFHSKM